MAIRRADGTEIDYPNGQVRLETGDRLLVVGASKELAALAEFAKGNAAVPGETNACQWVTVQANCTFLGKNLADFTSDQQYGVKVQAIRRDGKFIRFPHGNIELKTGDQVLLCGSFSRLNQLQQFCTAACELPLAIPSVKNEEVETITELQ
jgi:CPA2 family monovalent cation:H+ antiporter-2